MCTLFLEKLVSLAVHRLDQGPSIGDGPKLAPNAGQVHVDAAVMARMRASQSMLRKISFAHRMTDMTKQNLEQTKFRTGKRQGLSEPFGAALQRPHHQAAGFQRIDRGIMRRERTSAAKNRANSGDEFARCARFVDVVIRAELKSRNSIGIVASGRQHEHRQGALIPYALQHLESVRPRHQQVEHGDPIIARQRLDDSSNRFIFDMNRKSLLFEVHTEKCSDLDVIVDQ